MPTEYKTSRVVQDFGIANAAGTVAVNIPRGLKRFVVSHERMGV